VGAKLLAKFLLPHKIIGHFQTPYSIDFSPRDYREFIPFYWSDYRLKIANMSCAVIPLLSQYLESRAEHKTDITHAIQSWNVATLCLRYSEGRSSLE